MQTQQTQNSFPGPKSYRDFSSPPLPPPLLHLKSPSPLGRPDTQATDTFEKRAPDSLYWGITERNTH